MRELAKKEMARMNREKRRMKQKRKAAVSLHRFVWHLWIVMTDVVYFRREPSRRRP